MQNKYSGVNVIRDLYDGTIWNGMEWDDGIKMSLTMNADGAQCTKTTTKSMWMIQLYQNYLPPQLRYKRENILISTVHYEKKN